MSQPVGRCLWHRIISLVALLGAPAVAFGGTTVFVDPAAPAGGQGETWATAYRSLQDALAVVREAKNVAAVHVAQGIYAPDEGETVITGDRLATFRLISGVSIVGGFAGVNEKDPDQRDVVAFASVLTGDLARNDGPGFSGIEENSHHVVAVRNASDEAVLDGFTIRGGNADGPAPDERGGGIMIDGGEPVLRDIVFEDNTAFFGGAIFIDRGDPVLTRITFDDNSATFGGTIYADRSDMIATDANVRGGSALAGGGVYVTGGAPVFDRCMFFENDADLDGGGVYCSGTAPTFTDCEFRVNTAGFDGGAMYTVAGTPLLQSCTFITNFADEGAGLRHAGGAPMLLDCTFTLNFARRGGAMNGSGGEAVVTNCLFDRNESEAGGAVLTEDGMPIFTNCSFYGNEALAGGGFHATGGTPTIDSCGFDENEGGQRGGAILVREGAADIRYCSFTLNTAEGFFVSNGGGVDLIDATGTTISHCIFAENQANFGAGLGVLGDATVVDCEFLCNPGFIGGAMYLTEGAPLIERCTFSGNSTEGGVVAAGGAIHGLLVDAIVRDCLFDSNSASTTGGGLHIDGGSLEMTDCTFTGNTANGNGGGLFLTATTPTLTRCTFRDNVSVVFGGGVAAEQADGMYANCEFAGNRGSFGGGMVSLSGDPLLVNCVFSGNTAAVMGKKGCTGAGIGGGFSSLTGTPRIVNSTFASNLAGCGGSGGGVSMLLGELTNCVLWQNTDGGGSDESAQVFGTLVTVNFCCIQGLTGGLGGEGNIGADPGFVDLLGPDGTAGTLDDDLRLGAGSSCIDAGANDAVPTGIKTDASDLPRFVDDALTIDTGVGDPPLIDLGAFEYQPGACPADADGDGIVGFDDILLILSTWGPCPPVCTGDVSGNGMVDFDDVLIVIAAWGVCP